MTSAPHVRWSILSLLCLAPILSADISSIPHDHLPDLRVWKDAEGLFEIHASFVQARDERVQLRKPDGSVVWVPLNRLSLQDRVWVQARLAEIARLNGVVDLSAPPLLSILGVAGMVVIALVAVLLRRRPARFPGVLLLLLLPGAVGLLAGQEATAPPEIQRHFAPFEKKLQLRWDETYFYVGSNGFPDHPLMVGIRSWQQQVPLPQPYTGENTWRIPLHPRKASDPVSARKSLYRGAIALAVNGVPIFNPLNNRGDDTLLAGELDEFGGHCGRADDYHYHLGPVHLEKVVGKGKPIGYALDGYPLMGYTDATGKEPADLDEFNGRTDEDGQYRYYSTRTYPYINGGMRGEVRVRGDQIDPQPHAAPARPAGSPLRGATITGFTRDDVAKTYTLDYTLEGQTQRVRYVLKDDGEVSFEYIDGKGHIRRETYTQRDGPPGGGPWPGWTLAGAGVVVACFVALWWWRRRRKV